MQGAVSGYGWLRRDVIFERRPVGWVGQGAGVVQGLWTRVGKWKKGRLQEEHAVAVGVEAVAVADGVGVGGEDGLTAVVGVFGGVGSSEGCGQYEEGGFGEMEVGE